MNMESIYLKRYAERLRVLTNLVGRNLIGQNLVGQKSVGRVIVPGSMMLNALYQKFHVLAALDGLGDPVVF